MNHPPTLLPPTSDSALPRTERVRRRLGNALGLLLHDVASAQCGHVTIELSDGMWSASTASCLWRTGNPVHRAQARTPSGALIKLLRAKELAVGISLGTIHPSTVLENKS